MTTLPLRRANIIPVRAWFVVVLVACGAKTSPPLPPPPPLRPVTDTSPSPVTDFVDVEHLVMPEAVPSAAHDGSHLVPDFRDVLRWPLSAMSHPNLEPQFNIAAVFAQPGVGWIDLCKRGAQHRLAAGRDRDQLEYLRGWCAALQDDVDTACGKLAPLVRSSVRGMSAAVRIDIANILVSYGQVGKAEHWLARHHLDDSALLDTLAATYIEVGKDRDAYEINRRVMDSDRRANAATTCRRLVKHIVLSDPYGRIMPMRALEDLATKPRFPDKTCVALHERITCWNDPDTGCEPSSTSMPVGGNPAPKRASQQTPPAQKPAPLPMTATEALDNIGTPGNDAIAVSALEETIRKHGGCWFGSVAESVDRAQKAINNRELSERLRVLADACIGDRITTVFDGHISTFAC